MAEGTYNKKKFKIVINSPVVLGFTFICVIALIVNTLTGGSSNALIFSVYRAPLNSPWTYVRFFGHVFGHANWSHLTGNLMLLLITGPMLEERYGSKNLSLVIAVTAVITGLVQFIFFPHSALLGASGVVFAFILLSSITGFREKEIPLTFILVAVMYLGQQIYEGFAVSDNVSQLTHIVGGIVGAVMGYSFGRRRL